MTVDANDNGPTSSGDNRRRQVGIIAHLQSNYIDAALYFSRIGTLVCCISFLLAPLFSDSGLVGESWYRRALLASAATSALRLHQRMKNVDSRFSRVALAALLMEDSFHYLIFSILFAFVGVVSAAVMPVFLFALLHASNFTQVLLTMSAPPSTAATGDGPNVNVSIPTPSGIRHSLHNLTTKVKTNGESILRIIALCEIMLMPITTFVALSTRVIILPFAYYQFLKMRYNSHRNPYCRRAFYELRLSLEYVAGHASCPSPISRLIYGAINLASRVSSPISRAQ